MGCPIQKLYATNIGTDSGKIFLSAYKPEKKDGHYYRPHDTPIGFDMFVNNCLDLTEEEGTVQVTLGKSDTETGLWLICYDDYFGNEEHLYDAKPRFVEGTKKFDYEYWDELCDTDDNIDYCGLHVSSNLNMKAGEGPIPVTLIRV